MRNHFLRAAAGGGVEIVTSNLILRLDAGDPTSYPGSGTTWYDLSGEGNDGTLVNGPTYSSDNGGAIVFDGANDYIQLPTNSDLTFTGNFSYETWLWTDIQGQSRTVWSLPNGQTFQNDSSTVNPQIIYYSSQTGSRYFGALSNGTWGHFVLTKSGNTLTGYLNASQSWTTTPGSSATHNFSGSRIGYRTLSPVGYFWDGRMPVIHVYRNKALTAAEVQQNYDALKTRYGLS